LVELPHRLGELDPHQHIIVHCHAGGRSRRAAEFLMQHGFKHVNNLRGGISAWANEIDFKMPKY
jgi:adenylyltransferase/sulfurtransferase